MPAPGAYLQWHGNQFRVRMKVPTEARAIIGKGMLTVPLHTSDKREAERRKWPHVAELKRQIEDARKVASRGGNANDLEARAIRERIAAIPTTERVFADPESDDPATPYGNELYAADLAVRRIAATQGKQAAEAFAAVATGRATPLWESFERFTVERGYKQRTRTEAERTIRLLEEWLSSKHLPTTMEAVGRREAHRFIVEVLEPGRKKKTVRKLLSFLSSYWSYFTTVGDLDDNPWQGQRIAAPASTVEKRPFTDDEMRTLIYASPHRYLPDLMRIAALSGMRLEEICAQTVETSSNGWFRVLDGKTAAAKRDVPIHSGLRAIIERRREGKPPGALLFDELPAIPRSRQHRSDPASKLFANYRKRLGVDDPVEGERVGRIDFHSFRRWFARQERNARQRGGVPWDAMTFLSVFGHDEGDDRPKSLDLSQIRYAGPDAEAAKRALIESVRLPGQYR